MVIWELFSNCGLVYYYQGDRWFLTVMLEQNYAYVPVYTYSTSMCVVV